MSLEQANDTSSFGVEVDLPETGTSSEAGHGLHVSEDGVEETSSGGESD